MLNGKSNYRHDRLKSQILIILNDTLRDEIYDKLIKLVTFTRVDLSNDNSIATIYVDTYDRSKINKIIDKLNIATGVFRTALSKSLYMRRVPSIRFIIDDSFDKIKKLDEIIAKNHQN